MYKIAVLGDYDSIYGFAALGLDTFPVSDLEEAEEIFNRLTADQYAVIYVTEALAASLPHTIAKFKESLLPSIILIPWSRQSARIYCSAIIRKVCGSSQ